MKRLLLWLTLLATTASLCACGERSSSVSSTSSPHSITVTHPKGGWAETIEYHSGGENAASLTLDGVRFELRDPATFLLDWEAIDMDGITVTSSFTYKSTTPVEGALFSVSGKAVEIREGVLFWGTAEVGPVSAGDVVIVDGAGLRLQVE